LLGVLGAAPVVAAAGAALFAVHPVHVEAIASIVGRADLLVAVFSLVAVLAHLRLRTAGLRIPVVALCYAAALGAKESGVALPGLLLAVELVRAGDVRAFALAARRQWPLWAALLAVLALYFAARHAVLGTFTGRDVAPYIAALPAPLRVATAIANWSTYARLLFAPWELSADYGPAVTLPAGLLSLRFWAGLLILAGSLALAWLGRARAPLAALGVLWFTVAVFPVTNLLVATPVWIAERTLYSPSIAAALLLAALGAELQRREPRARRLATAGLALVLVLFGVRSWQRSRTWADSDTVARTLITERPESFRSAWWLARMLAASGQYERAAAHFERARSLLPGSAGVAGDYAGMLLDAGRPAEAEAVLRRLPLDESADMGIYLVRALVMQARHREAAAVLDTLRARFPRDWRLPALASRLDPVPVAPR
ncbi:MAG TPA: tetratricopeptide repeat protein, partial [Longimicrobiales bacterium]|nr:tetratricopeptide repeat protein [Longimicrobiales bacterium]